MSDLIFSDLDADLAKLDGRPPYDQPWNFCRNDPYFGKSLEEKWGLTLEEIRELWVALRDGKVVWLDARRKK